MEASDGPDSAPSRQSFPLSRLCTVIAPLEEGDPDVDPAATAAATPPLLALWAVGDGRMEEAGTMTSSKTIRC